MNTELLIGLTLGCTLLIAGALYSLVIARRRKQHHEQQESQLLQRCLQLLQALQKHRGLSMQQDPQGISQRNALAHQLDQLWLEWSIFSHHLPPLHQHWPQLRRNSADFEAHCQLIEALLKAIEQLEDRHYKQGHVEVRGLGEACRALEDLARLRGLATRAANFERCPSGLQMQMRFLCQRLLDQQPDPALHALIERLKQDLIDAPRVKLTPQECFTLLTPLIEQRLQGIRLSLH